MIKQRLAVITLFLFISGFTSCSGSENPGIIPDGRSIPEQYSIYIINYSFHTGIVIPVNNESLNAVTALVYFKQFSFTDIGWGEEKFYQNPGDNYCMGARAILLPNRSVLRIEGYSSRDNFILWSNYVVQIYLTKEEYLKLLAFISQSFAKQGSDLIIASEKHSGEVIFFNSIYRYHLFNTCNTWIAEALKVSGLDVSPFLTITAGQLYDEIKDKGRVIKALK